MGNRLRQGYLGKLPPPTSARAKGLSAFPLVALRMAPLVALLVFTRNAAADCNPVDLFPGTVYYDNVLLAQSQNASVFGAARTLDREITPHLRRLSDKDDYVFTVFYGWSMVRNAARAPARMAGCANDGLAWLPYDLHSYNMAAAFRIDQFSFFYSAAGTGGGFVSDAGDRAGMAAISWLGGFLYSYLAPFVGSARLPLSGFRSTSAAEKKFNQLRVDYTVGAQYDFGKLNIRAGYLGSKGLYTNLDAPDLRVFATTVFNQEFSNLGYLSAGFYSLRSFAKGLQDAVGMTSIYGRKVQSLALRSADMTAQTVEPVVRSIDFWTAHLEQKDFKKLVDAEMATAVYPKPRFHVGRIGIHTGKHNWEAQLIDRSGKPEHQDMDGSAGITAGVVSLPSLPYYASKGGEVFSLSAEARLFVNHAVFRWMLRYNDPDLLAIFPYAVGAWQTSVYVNVVQR